MKKTRPFNQTILLSCAHTDPTFASITVNTIARTLFHSFRLFKLLTVCILLGLSSVFGGLALIAGELPQITDFLQPLGENKPALAAETNAPLEQGATGEILWEFWDTSNTFGSTLDILRSDPDFPANPDQTGTLTSALTAINQANTFGQRIRGLIYPPVTGDYTFWISSDDQGELWLSSDDTAIAVSLIANVPLFSSLPSTWTTSTPHSSVPISLVAGQAYYLEALAQEGGSGDHLAVAWQIPGSTTVEIIDGQYLSLPINHPPTATDDSSAVDEDSTTDLDVLTNDFDVDGDSLAVISVGQPANGSAAINVDNSIAYTPTLNFIGTDTFTYTIDDGNGEQDEATVTVTVSDLNDPPTAVDDSTTVDEDNVLSGTSVLSNDADPESQPLTAMLESGVTNGLLTLNLDGTYIYTPTANFNGSDSFTYRANDGMDPSNIATVSITVNAVNDAPTAVDDSEVIDENNTTFVAVLANDTDVDGDSLAVNSIGQPDNGTATIELDQTIAYTPTLNFNGTDTFTYTVDDGNGGQDEGTVTLTITDLNDPPAAVDDSAAVNEDEVLTGTSVLNNDTDPEAQPLTATLEGSVSNGQLALNLDGTFIYTPTGNFNGSDNFTYRATDGEDPSNVATVSITVNPINDAPTAVDDASIVDANAMATLDVRSNDLDIDGDLLAIDSVGQPNNGVASVTLDESIAYTPTLNFIGTDTFTYSIDDGNGGQDEATVTLTVSDPNATSLTIEMANKSGVTGYEIGIFGAEFGPSQGSGTVQILGVNSQIVEWSDGFIKAVVPTVADGSGTLVVTNASGEQGIAPFTTYTIDPQFIQEPTRRFENIAEGKQAYLSNLLEYFCFTQPDNSELAPEFFLFDYTCGYQNITNVGDATFNSPGSVALQADAPLSGDYYLQFFTKSSWYTFYDVPQNYEIQVSSNSTDGVDGNWLTLVTITGNDRATRLHLVTIPSGTYQWMRIYVSSGTGAGSTFKIREIRVYEAMGSASGPLDSFALYGDSLTADAFEIIGRDGLPRALSSLRSTSDDLILSVYGLSGQNSSGLLDGSTDVDIYDALALDDMTNNATYWGIALGTGDTFGGNGSIGVPGTNIEEYDNRLDAIVQELISRNRIPLIARIPDTIEALDGFGDYETKQKALSDIDSINAQYKLIPGPDFYTSFRRNAETAAGSYFGDDGTHHSKEGQVALVDQWTVALATGIPFSNNTPPNAVNDSATVDEDAVLSGASVLANDTDPDADPLTVSLESGVTDGLLMLHLDGTFVYTPNADFNGSDSFAYRASDGSAASNIATVNITVNPVNDDPTAVDDSASTDENIPVIVAILTNDDDIDLDSLSVGSVGLPANGIAAVNLDETVTYTPSLNFSGTDTFTYTVEDGNGGTAEATVTVDVNDTLQPPGQVVQVAPQGDIPQGAVTFVWQADSLATGYTLVIYRVDTQGIYFSQDYQASAICGASECSTTPSAAELTLTEGSYLWLVRAFNPAGAGPWSFYQQ